MPTRKPPRVPRLAKPGTVGSYTNVLLEQIRSQVTAVIERVDASDARNERRINELREELVARIDVLEASVRLNSDDIRGQGTVLREQGATLQEHGSILREHSSILQEHGSILREHSSILREHSLAFERIEARFDGLDRKLDSHEMRLALLEAK